jgi:hypothetical protein
MPLSDDELVATLLQALDDDERRGAIVYRRAEPVAAGEVVSFPGVELRVDWDALLAFVDRFPQANWAHSCRYVLIGRETGDVRSTEARLPPFLTEGNWSVVYSADAPFEGP